MITLTEPICYLGIELSMNNKRYIPIILSTLLGCIIFLISRDYGMFWDNVLFASKMGNQLYENGIFNWTIPDAFDPGHPPFLAFILAIFWKLFGHSLWVSHLAMLPFVIGTLYQIHRFVNHYTKNNLVSSFGALLIIIDPTLSTSFVLVNPEIIILFFFFLAVNGMLYDQRRWKFIGLLFLSIITFRSMMLFAGLFLFEILNNTIIQKRKPRSFINFKFIGFYLLASLPGIMYVVWRLSTKGWLQTHPDSPWSTLWYFPSLQEFFNNIAVLGWRYLDFGRVFIFVFLLSALLIFRKRLLKNPSIRQLLVLAVSSVVFIVLASLLSTNAFGHRYFIVSYIAFILMAFLILRELKKGEKVLYALLFIGLLSGNLWVYPEKISQGWDATLAHTPYHSLRQDAIEYIDAEKINFKEVGTFFPNYNTLDQIDLNGDTRSFSRFAEEDQYIFYSNVYNVTDDEITVMKEHYEEIKRFSSWKVYISILKRKAK